MTTVYDFTAQDYEGLQRLQKDLADRGFAVLGFPCNQFGHQEPGDAVEIARWLKKEAKGLLGSESIKWNFTKFLVSLGPRGEALRSDRCARGFASGYRETLIGLARGLTGLISTRS